MPRSGIGRATAEAVAAGGGRLFLTDVARRPAGHDRCRRSGSAVARWSLAEPVDLTDHDGVRRLARRVTDEHGAMDVVMNIAGISAWGTVQSLEHATWRRQVEVNLMGPIHVIEELVPPMVEAGRGGHLVNVSSAAGIIGMPWHAAYSASKFGLRGVSEVLRFDLARHGIGVSLVCPGAVHTPLTAPSRSPASTRPARASARCRPASTSGRSRRRTAATAILKGVRRNRYWVYTSPDIRLIHAVQRYFPPAYVLAMRCSTAAPTGCSPRSARPAGPTL